MRKFLLICAFVVCGAPAEASQSVTQWYVGHAPPDITGAPTLQRIIEARQALAAAGY